MSIAAARQIIESSVKPVFIIFDEKRGLFYMGALQWIDCSRGALRWSDAQYAETERDRIAQSEGMRRPEILVLPVLP